MEEVRSDAQIQRVTQSISAAFFGGNRKHGAGLHEVLYYCIQTELSGSSFNAGSKIMAFTDFKSADQVQKAYQIRSIEQDFFTAMSRALPDYFVREFEFNRENFDIFGSEASRCEAVIYPILREACKSFIQEYSLWSHKSIAADDILTGTPDYIVAKRSQLGKNVLDFPLVLIAEAKQNDFVRGWGQCLAEMVAAQRLNGNAELAIYGIVTDGEIWQFGKLVGSVFTKNRSRLTIDRLEEVYGGVFGLIELSVSLDCPCSLRRK